MFNAIKDPSDRTKIWVFPQSALKVLGCVFSTQNEPETYLQLYHTVKIEVSKVFSRFNDIHWICVTQLLWFVIQLSPSFCSTQHLLKWLWNHFYGSSDTFEGVYSIFQSSASRLGCISKVFERFQMNFMKHLKNLSSTSKYVEISIWALFNAMEELQIDQKIRGFAQSALKVLWGVFSNQNEPETYLQRYHTTKI